VLRTSRGPLAVAGILLATRFRLREIAVPPGAVTMELLGALAPALTDALVRWTQSAVTYLAGGAAPTAVKVATKKARRQRAPVQLTRGTRSGGHPGTIPSR
jgi:hypothetical protein